jgi:hypothetical protein
VELRPIVRQRPCVERQEGSCGGPTRELVVEEGVRRPRRSASPETGTAEQETPSDRCAGLPPGPAASSNSTSARCRAPPPA